LELKFMVPNQSLSPLISTDRHGAVTLRGSDFTETWRRWGHPDGFGVSGCKRESYNNQLSPLMLNPVLVPGKCAEEFRPIRDSIPEEFRGVVADFQHWPIEHIQLAECHPQGYLNLSEQNPALLNHLASLSAQHTLWGVKHWGALLGHTQKYIALQSGLDPKMLGYLARIKDEALLTHGYMAFAVTAWRRIGMARLLAHVRDINLDVILLALNEWDLVRDCPSLLHIAAGQPTLEHRVFDAVCVIRAALRRSRRGWRWDKINSLSHLERIRGEVLADAATFGSGCLVYPSPPISPCSEWQAVTTEAELGEHVARHGNCAGEHAWQLTIGVLAIYETRGTAPQDTTIVVLVKDGAGWHVQDVLGTRNSLVEPELEANVRGDFSAALEAK
jgi:hypothetical protein